MRHELTVLTCKKNMLLFFVIASTSATAHSWQDTSLSSKT